MYHQTVRLWREELGFKFSIILRKKGSSSPSLITLGVRLTLYSGVSQRIKGSKKKSWVDLFHTGPFSLLLSELLRVELSHRVMTGPILDVSLSSYLQVSFCLT